MGFIVKAVKSVVKAVVGVAAKVLGGIFGFSVGSGSKKTKAANTLNKQLDPEAFRKIVFGRTAAPLDLRFWEVYGSKGNLYAEVIALASHRINSVLELYLEDKLAVNANGVVQPDFVGVLGRDYRRGLNGQTAMVVGSGTQWNSAATFDYVAHMALYWTPDEKKLPNGIPSRYTQVIEGCPVYDPRRDSTRGGVGAHRWNDRSTWEYAPLDSNGQPIGRNNALQALAYILGWKVPDPVGGETLWWGRSVDIEDINLQTFISGANACEVAGYYTDLALSTEDDHTSNEDKITCNGLIGRLLDPGGLWSYYANVDDTALIAADLTDADVLDNSAVKWQEYKGMSEQFNQVGGKFINPSAVTLFQAFPYPLVRDTVYEEQLGVKRRKSLDFQQVLDSTLAQRLARLALNEGQYQGEFSANWNYKAARAQAWSIVRYTSERFGWTKLFRVWRHEISTDAGCSLLLKEIHSSIWGAGTVTPPVAPGAGIKYDPRMRIPVLGLTLLPSTIVGNDGSIYDAFNVSWTLAPENTRRTEIRYRVTGTTFWETAGPVQRDTNSIVIGPLVRNTSYEVQVRHISVHEVEGDWANVGNSIVSGSAGNVNYEGIYQASQTANWSQVVDNDPVNHPKPADGATVGAPVGTLIGPLTVEVVVDTIQQIPDRTEQVDLQLGGLETAVSALALVDLDEQALRRQARRQLDEANALLLAAVVDSEKYKRGLRDAGVIYNPQLGKYTIYGVDYTTERLNQVSVDLDATKATVALKASSAEVDEKIALAVIDPSQIAEFSGLTARIGQAEIEIDGIEAAVNLRATQLDLDGAKGRITQAELDIDAAEAQIALKTNTTDFDELGQRVGSAELALGALGAADVVGLRVAIKQAHFVAENALQDALVGLIKDDQNNRGVLSQLVEARQELTTTLNQGLLVEAAARTALAASTATATARLDAAFVSERLVRIAENQAAVSAIDALEAVVNDPNSGLARAHALISIESVARVNGDNALSQTIQILTATVNSNNEVTQSNSGAIQQLQNVTADTNGVVARTTADLRAATLKGYDNAHAALDALVRGDQAAREAMTQLVQARQELTIKIIEDISSEAQQRLQLAAELRNSDATINAAIDLERTARTTATNALAQQILQLSATVTQGDQQNSAAILAEVGARANAVEAVSNLLNQLSAAVNDPTTGLARAHALYTQEAQARVDGDSALSQTINQISAALNDPNTGLAKTLALVNAETIARTDADSALSQTINQLSGTVNDPNTGLARAHALVSAESQTRAQQDTALADSITAISGTINDPNTGLPRAHGRINEEAQVRADNDTANAQATANLTAVVNNPDTGLSRAHGRISEEAQVRAQEDSAIAGTVTQIGAVVSHPDTGLVRAHSRITDEANTRAGADNALTVRANSIDAVINDPNTGLAKAHARAASLEYAVTDPNGAVAGQVNQVSARLNNLGGTGVSVENRMQATIDRVGNLEGKYTVAVDVNGNVTGFQLLGSNSGPGQFNLWNADMHIGTGRIMFNNGTYMKVQGVAFGAHNDLLSWFGPSMAVDQCSRANAINYEAVDGDVRFSGAIISGAFENNSTSTDLAANASHILGPFGSQGRPKQLNFGYLWQTIGLNYSTDAGSNSGNAILEFHRDNNDNNWQYLGNFGASGVAEWSAASQFGPGQYSAYLSGAVTFTDYHPSSQDYRYRLRLVSRNLPGGGQPGNTEVLQRLSIFSREA